MITRGKHTEIELAYTAGLIDGEGHIIIEATRRSNPKYKCVQHILMIGCTNTNLEIIEWISKTYGSSKPIRKRNHEKNPRWKTAYEWNISAKKALVFLEMIYPYLKIKKEQARLCIEFQKDKMNRKFTTSGITNGHTLSKETLSKREEYYLKVKKLNQKGIAAATTK